MFSLRNTIRCHCKVWNLRWRPQVSWIHQYIRKAFFKTDEFSEKCRCVSLSSSCRTHMKGSSEPLPNICREIRFVFRYIGLLANMTFDTGVRENAQEEKTSRLAASVFKQVSFASAWMHVRNVRSQKIFEYLFLLSTMISAIFSWRRGRWRIFTSCTRRILKCSATQRPNTSTLHSQTDFFDNKKMQVWPKTGFVPLAWGEWEQLTSCKNSSRAVL